MRRPPYRAHIRWHRWMPWYELSRQVGEWQAHNEEGVGLPLSALGVAAAALMLTLLAPAFAFPLVIVGGLLATVLVVCRGENGARLVAALRAEGLPSPGVVLRLGAQLVAEDAHALWNGRAVLDAAPLPLLLEGEIVKEDQDRGELDP